MSKLVFSLIKALNKAAYNFIFTFDKNKFFIDFIESLSRDNIFYTKFLQSICSNTNIFNKIQMDYLKKFLDHVPFNNNELYDDLKLELEKVGKDNEELIIDLDTLEIINSGIIGIVYKAKMREKTVAVKVIKNNIKNKIYEALNDYEIIIKILSYFSLFKFYHIDDIYYSNKNLMIQQLNFNSELDNIKNFYKNNKNTDYVEIPVVYEEFTKSNNKIIVMDYLDGRKIDNLKDEEKEEYIEQIVNFAIKSIIFNRLFHCDLHLGNVIFLDNPKRIGIIDYGIVANLTKENQKYMYNFFYELFKNKNFDKASRILLNNCTEYINKDKNIILNPNTIEKINSTLKSLLERKFDIDPEYIYNLNKDMYKDNLKLNEMMGNLELSLCVTNGLCSRLLINSNLIDKVIKLFENLDM
jgi:predicted unusual protein kinase regulating ubiquinone biosynthesis (AarF/ABC1/UbiB family)